MEEEQIKQILVKQNFIDATEMNRVEKIAKTHQIKLGEALINEGLITAELLSQAIAESYGVDYVNLIKDPPTPEEVKRIPEALAKKLRVTVASIDKKTVTVATDNPVRKDLPAQLSSIFPDKKITIVYASADDLEIAAFIHYRKPLETRFSTIISSQRKVAPEIIEEIIADALLFHASDIHLEPQASTIVVRFRVDGLLHEAGRIPKQYYDNIVNRVKIQAHLRIDEHHNPQDGAMHYEKNNYRIDLRISIIPILEGEKIVMRLLGSYLRVFNLHEIGLSKTNEAIIHMSASKPFGMILVVGPTGSGKTTTLYALLKILNNPDINITTIEDPVEYKTVGINQIQVNPATDLTFARGLRSIVRQDPDIILVGEIRDQETAEIAVNAALTGHLLLSTFHANDAATALPRLLDMGVEPFLLASTMELIIAQRLIRRLCEQCRYSVTLTKSALSARYPMVGRFFASKKITLYESKGCDVCHHSGYTGQIALFEIIQMTPEMKALTLKNPSTKQIWDLARQQGSRHLFEDGLEKVQSGITSLDELLRVATAPGAA